MASEGQLDLPKGVVKRIVEEKLAGISDAGKDVQLNKEALLAFAESAKVFISYVTAAANDVCKEKKRQTLSADDVFAALDELEFQELVPQLKEAFEAYKQSTKEKKEKKAEISRKRKSAGQAADGQDTAAPAAGDIAGDQAVEAAADGDAVDAEEADGAAADAEGDQQDEDMKDEDAAEHQAEDEEQ